MSRLLLATLVLFQLCHTVALAQTPAETEPAAELQSVEVAGIKNPGMRSYRQLAAGLDAFDEFRDRAPTVDVLRFGIKPKHDDEPMTGLVLRIAGKESSVALPIARDGTFVLPRDQAAFDEDADLILNRKRGLFDGMPVVRSANVPANMRRLGDVQLECRVAIAIAKKEMNFALRAIAASVLGTTDWCKSRKISFGTSAPYPSDSITLVSGSRRVVMHQGSQQKYFSLPLSDTSWPDDTLIEFQPSAPPTVAQFSASPLFISGSMNKWKPTLPLKQINETTFSAEVVLPKGLSRFLVVSSDHRAVNLGAADTRANLKKGSFVLDAGKTLAWAGPNIQFEPPAAGTYTFVLDVRDPKAPVLTISARGEVLASAPAGSQS